jgi:osmoprotectant transport system substrate-binding protein
VTTAAVLLVALTSCSHARSHRSDDGTLVDAVTIASFNFAESQLLAEIYAQALENADVPVRRELDLGPRELVQPAMRQGLVDVVPEYLGTALASVTPDARVDATDPTAVLAALRNGLGPWRLTALQPSSASDQNGFAVTRATALRLGVSTLSELAARPPVVFGGPTECPTRPYCLAGLKRVYGLRVAKFVPIDDESQRAAALSEGVVDVAVTFTTNGQLATGRLVLLRDDRGLQPTEQIVPVVSDRALQRYGARLQATLDAISARLDTAGLRFLNWRISVAGKDIATEARGWLRRHGLLRRG